MSDKYEFSIVALRKVIEESLEEMMAESLSTVIYRKVDSDVEDFLYEHKVEEGAEE